MRANHAARCPLCKRRIRVGDYIARWMTTWAHIQCVDKRLAGESA